MGDFDKRNDHLSNSVSLEIFPNKIKREELRTDEYLIIPDVSSVGIKKRQGKLEVKAQIGKRKTT
jgi:hypothetical protein